MQEPHLGAFLHHLSPIPRKRPELEVRAEFGLLSKEVKREARRPPPFVLLFFILIPERKELTTNTTSPPFVVNSNHFLASPAFPHRFPSVFYSPTKPPNPPDTPGT